eukprot:2785029-Pleurochrysis_carterae.AAC.10
MRVCGHAQVIEDVDRIYLITEYIGGGAPPAVRLRRLALCLSFDRLPKDSCASCAPRARLLLVLETFVFSAKYSVSVNASLRSRTNT